MDLVYALLLNCLLFINGGLAASTTGDKKYVVVVDAGSTHTGFLVYEYEQPDCRMVQVHDCEAGEEPDSVQSIDQFVDDPGQLGPFLTTCLEKVKALLLGDFGVSDMAQVKLSLGATGSMRALNVTNPEGARNIMQEIRGLFAESGFAFNTEDAFILDGPDEGAYGWIAANFLLGKFVNKATSTAGMLDMGTTSTQIGFQCDEDTTDSSPYSCQTFDPTDLRTFTIKEQSYTVLSHSTNCYGLEEAMRRLITVLAYNNFKATGEIAEELENPCLPEGWSEVERSTWLINFPTDPKEIFGLSICNSEFPDSDFQASIDKILSDDSFAFRHKPAVAGDGGIKCREFVAKFLLPEECSNVFPSGTCWDFLKWTGSQKTMTGHNDMFYAMSSYWWEFFRLMTENYDEDEVVSLETVEEILKTEICTAKNDDRIDESIRSQTDCFIGTFIKYILTESYGTLLDSKFSTIHFINEVEGTEVSWPLGLAYSKEECP